MVATEHYAVLWKKGGNGHARTSQEELAGNFPLPRVGRKNSTHVQASMLCLTILQATSLAELKRSGAIVLTDTLPSAIALLNSSAIAARPRWSEYRIRAWEPTTCFRTKITGTILKVSREEFM